MLIEVFVPSMKDIVPKIEEHCRVQSRFDAAEGHNLTAEGHIEAMDGICQPIHSLGKLPQQSWDSSFTWRQQERSLGTDWRNAEDMSQVSIFHFCMADTIRNNFIVGKSLLNFGITKTSAWSPSIVSQAFTVILSFLIFSVMTHCMTSLS